MNIFTDHNYGHFADDGFGNLQRLTRAEIITALFVCIGYDTESEYYD